MISMTMPMPMLRLFMTMLMIGMAGRGFHIAAVPGMLAGAVFVVHRLSPHLFSRRRHNAVPACLASIQISLLILAKRAIILIPYGRLICLSWSSS